MVKSYPITPLDRKLALLVGAVVGGLLVRGVPLDLLPGDAGEFQVAAWKFGLAHATGYPLYLLLGGLWQHLWAGVGGSPAATLNLLSALLAGGTAGLLFVLLVGWLPGTPAVRRLAAGLGVAWFVANPTLRSQALQAEVYTLHALLVVGLLWTLQQLPDSASGAGWARRFAWLACGLGLGLAHHATTLLLLPALLLFLAAAHPGWWRSGRGWLWALPAGLAPLLLYLYIPLRSGPDASPWYHQRLGDSVLDLSPATPAAFWAFVSGQSISVGFHDLQTALALLPTAAVLWLRHFEWPGLVLAAAGLYTLIRLRAWPLLALTGSYFLLQQLFNLFYAIGDIFVYYIPLYLIVSLWIAFAGAGIGSGFQPADRTERTPGWAPGLLCVLLALPAQLWLTYTPLLDQLQRDSAATRQQWESILAAQPPEDAILVSNDRNELVPLFYLQQVEGRRRDLTGLFPLIHPGWSDIGVTLQQALEKGGSQPVYLIKPMAGLEARFTLYPRTPPLVEVAGPAAQTPPAQVLNRPYGPLLLQGYSWTNQGRAVEVTLYWSVLETLAQNYTTTVQLFDASGTKRAQSDHPAGGIYYPTSLWKPGETLVDRHLLSLSDNVEPAQMQVGMYTGAEAALLAPPLELTLEGEMQP